MADLLIKGWDMPENCMACPLHDYGQIDEWDMYCKLTNNLVGNYGDRPKKKRDKACPLVEIPTHGRLIDADELRNRVMAQIQGSFQNGNKETLVFAQGLKMFLEHSPTVIDESEEKNTPSAVGM